MTSTESRNLTNIEEHMLVNLKNIKIFILSHEAELQIRGGMEDNSKEIFLVSQQKPVL